MSELRCKVGMHAVDPPVLTLDDPRFIMSECVLEIFVYAPAQQGDRFPLDTHLTYFPISCRITGR